MKEEINMKQYTVAVLGVTGAVGQEMLHVLQERNFPVGRLVPLASARSAGKTVKFRGEEITIREANENAFEGVDIVLGAAENDVAQALAPAIIKAGAVFVDNSSAFRMDPNVPLIVPEVNPEDVKNHKGIISNPNCSTIITLTAVNALNQFGPIRTMNASTYQAVSGAGAGGPIELQQEVEALSRDVMEKSRLVGEMVQDANQQLNTLSGSIDAMTEQNTSNANESTSINTAMHQIVDFSTRLTQVLGVVSTRSPHRGMLAFSGKDSTYRSSSSIRVRSSPISPLAPMPMTASTSGSSLCISFW